MILESSLDNSRAWFSNCRRYRYRLDRPLHSGSGRIVWAMLNPSTADAFHDDNTVTRCRIRSAGYSVMTVLNVYAYRSTDPAKLPRDPSIAEGPDNAATWAEVLALPDLARVVVAWGARDAATASGLYLLGSYEGPLWCLGRTRDGHPRHPLYVPGSQGFEEWDHIGDAAEMVPDLTAKHPLESCKKITPGEP